MNVKDIPEDQMPDFPQDMGRMDYDLQTLIDYAKSCIDKFCEINNLKKMDFEQ